jgi:ABC-type glycerol-3-phosphate transport system permease component
MRSNRLTSVIFGLILGAATIIAVFPFYLMLVMATRSNQQIITQFYLLPGDQVINNAKMVFESGFLVFYWNSFLCRGFFRSAGCVHLRVSRLCLGKISLPRQ